MFRNESRVHHWTLLHFLFDEFDSVAKIVSDLIREDFYS